ncbi:MAG: type II 3-dehydroquinate dehydratase [Lysobacterales bacterium]
MRQILIMNGPNLDRLGSREPEIYGHMTLADITTRLDKLAAELDLSLEHFQSNAEHELVERLHQAADQGVQWLIINPAAFTHTSIALRDALIASELRFIEIHLSNPESREAFRHTNFVSDLAHGRICGLGPLGYELGLRAIAQRLSTSSSAK